MVGYFGLKPYRLFFWQFFRRRQSEITLATCGSIHVRGAHCILKDGVCNRIRVDIQGVIIIVGVGVASQMVTRVILLTSGAAPDRGFGGCLDSLGAREETTGGDSNRNKRTVV